VKGLPLKNTTLSESDVKKDSLKKINDGRDLIQNILTQEELAKKAAELKSNLKKAYSCDF